ncbi:MAG: TetR/AcrR family transcriptional regulator [Defluviitaleaceae bacterium]|nr:TetR/AcrR family transcriptional regulator [Defluviitaleaceae bacterium]
MSNKTYHHGDLRTAMIEKGLEAISEGGVKNLSLRKVASACGVSHAAPYSHFKNKKELLGAIESHITAQFTHMLKEAAKGKSNTPEALLEIGCAYVLFFIKNPQYFEFIFDHSEISVGGGHVYEPYDFFKDFMEKTLDKLGHSKEDYSKTLIAQWAMMQGLVHILTRTTIKNGPPLEEIVKSLLSKNYMIFPQG